MKAIFPFLLSCLFSIGLYAQEAHENFDQYVKSAVDSFELPGLAISIVKGDEVVFQNTYGYKNANTKEAITPNSVFAIASLSKAFTATAIAMLVDDGKLAWNDRVKDHLPYFTLKDEHIAAKMTIEDILCHRSGFKTFDGDLLWYGTTYSPKEIIEHFGNYNLSYDHRTTYGYQNIMFIVAGQIVEEVSGMTLGAFMKKRIFDPLGMQNTFSSITQFKKNTDIAMPHVKGELDELRNYENSAGAALLSSNIVDLNKWIAFWLNEGVYKNDTLLTKATYYKILDIHTPISPSNFNRQSGIEFNGYGLGWFLTGYEGSKIAHHGGGLPGFISKIFLVPSKKLGGIILTNGESYLPSALMYSAIDEFNPSIESDKDWAATYLMFAKFNEARLEKQKEERHAKRNAALKSNIPVNDIVGTYEDVYYGKAKVVEKDGKLHLSLLPTKAIFSSEMTHWQQNTYRIKFKDQFLPEGFITFYPNANGEVMNFTVDLPNPDFHFHNLKFDKIK